MSKCEFLESLEFPSNCIQTEDKLPPIFLSLPVSRIKIYVKYATFDYSVLEKNANMKSVLLDIQQTQQLHLLKH